LYVPSFFKRNRTVSPYHQPQTVSTLTLIDAIARYVFFLEKSLGSHSIPPVEHGWKSNDDQLYPVLMAKGPATKSFAELTSCRCDK